MTRRLALLISIAAAAIAVLAPVAQSSAATSPSKVTNFSPLRTGAGDAGKYHAVAVNPKTGAQIVFYTASAGAGAYLATQRFNDTGPVGSENIVCDSNGGVCTDQTSWQYSIAYNPATGGWIAIYHDQGNDQILGQLLNADGSVSGAPFTTVDGLESPSYAGSKVVWNSSSQKFLVTATSYYDDVMRARFVTGNGVASGSSFDVITGLDADYCPMDTAYSTKSNAFLAVAGGKCSPDTDERPLFQYLSGDGTPQGAVEYLGPTGGDSDYSASVAYNSVSDEFGVVWGEDPGSGNVLYLQRVDASDGSKIGSPIALAPPEGFLYNGYRPRIAAGAGGYYVTAFLISADEVVDGWYSFRVSEAGTTDSLDGLLSASVGSVNRPQNAYNPASGRFLTTFSAAECVPDPVRSPLSNRGVPCTDAYNLYSLGGGTKSASKPSIKKLGTAGGTSARVKLGCGGSGKCTIKLSGKLKGGSGKVVAQTVKLKAGKKATVTVDYSQELIDQLAARGGGKIKLTARQVGGKSSSITLVVPSSVTG